MSPEIAPVKNAKYRQIRIFGKPRTRPKTNANLISPPPIPRPRVIKLTAKKKRKAPSPDKIKFNGFEFKRTKDNETIRAG